MAVKILVVDDEAQYVDLIRNYLESRQFEVLTAPNGEVGLELAREKKPHLIIMDIHMPVMDGYHAVKALRETGAPTAHIPIVILTARAKMKDAFAPDDIAGFVEKPIDLETLLSEVRDVLLRKGIKDPKREKSALLTGVEWPGTRPVREFLESRHFEVAEYKDVYQAIEAAIRRRPDLLIISTALEEADVVAVTRLFRHLPTTRRVLIVVYDLTNMKRATPFKVNDIRSDLFVDCATGEDLLHEVRNLVREYF